MPFDGHQGQFGDVGILLDAREKIAGHTHWVKGKYTDGDRWCIVGALSAACASQSLKHPTATERRLTRRLAKELPWKIWAIGAVWYPLARMNLISFNDRPKTTHADVLALFDRAIERITAEQAAVVECELARS